MSLKKISIKGSENIITPRDTESIKIYLKEIGKIPILTPDQEYELFKQMESGDLTAREKILKHNLRFVVSVAKKFISQTHQEKTIQFCDLVSQGNIGLINAIDKYDITKGFKFISFAVWNIQQQIIDFSIKTKTVKLQNRYVFKINRFKKELQKREVKEGRIIQFDEFLYDTSLSKMKIKTIQATNYFLNRDNIIKLHDEIPDIFSDFDNYISSKDDEELEHCYIDTLADDSEYIKPDYSVMKESDITNIERAFSTLPEIEKDILLMFYGIYQEEMTCEQIGLRFNYSAERIRQLREQAIKRLRHPFRANFILSGNGKINVNNKFRF